MRHERINQDNIAAATWPSTLDSLVLTEPPVAPAAAPEPPAAALPQTGPTPAAPDVAAGVGGLIVAAYGGLILVFFLFFTGSLLSTMAVTIAAAFVAIFFTLPRIFFGMEPKVGRRPTMGAFMENGMETLTGHCTGGEALVQMLIVPVLLTLGLLAIGILSAI